MTSGVQIVAVQSDEQYQQVHQLILEYAASRNFDAALSKIFTELDHLADYYTLILLACHEQEPAGCVAIQTLEEGICEMKRLYVKPDFRKAGIGKLLVERLIAESVARGFQRMRLDSHPNMMSAHKLYSSFGFQEIGRYNQNPIPGIRFFELQLATSV